MERNFLTIGKINYANLFPIFYMLQNGCDCSAYKFVEGVPAEVNRLLREGAIDMSPSSSVEYLRHKDIYTVLEGHSISSFGPIGSILLFSKKTMENLNGLTVLTSSQSETSAALLDIILKKFYSVESRLEASSEPLLNALESHPAYLLIGDDALKALASYKLQVASKNSGLYIYDLGDLWHKHTGLPFVFALWIARKDFCSEMPQLLEKFKQDLNSAKINALKDLKAIANKSPLSNMLSRDEIVSYWQAISYDLNEAHKKGLELFQKYADEIGLL